MNKNLVILRCGRTSLHQHWLTGENKRTWDLALCPFQDIDEQTASIIPPYKVEGRKWTGLDQLLLNWQGWREYDFIWLPDDDLLCDMDTVNALFALSKAYGTRISAPALSEDSYCSHATTLKNQTFFARAVIFIEIMMPCFRRDVLELVLPTLSTTKTGDGWGLDYLWPCMIDYQDMMIFDHITVRHTRPVSTRDKALRDQNAEEAQRNSNGRQHMFKTTGAFDASGNFRPADAGGFLLDYLNGYRYLIQRNDLYLPWLIEQQK